MQLYILIFGVISVSQLKGKFYYCEEAQGELPVENKWDCFNAGGLWLNQIYQFDDIPNAIITLFVMATTAGWQDVLINACTSTEIDYVSESTKRNPFWILFYIFFMIIGFFFFLNLFIGVVVTTFNSEQDRLGGNDLLTERQREWIDLKLIVLRSAPIKKIRPPIGNRFRMLCYKI